LRRVFAEAIFYGAAIGGKLPSGVSGTSGTLVTSRPTAAELAPRPSKLLSTLSEVAAPVPKALDAVAGLPGDVSGHRQKAVKSP
jgi:hypothetical protein